MFHVETINMKLRYVAVGCLCFSNISDLALNVGPNWKRFGFSWMITQLYNYHLLCLLKSTRWVKCWFMQYGFRLKRVSFRTFIDGVWVLMSFLASFSLNRTFICHISSCDSFFKNASVVLCVLNLSLFWKLEPTMVTMVFGMFSSVFLASPL